MKVRKALLGALTASALLALASPAAAPAASATQAWSLQSLAAPTNFKPGDSSGRATYEVFLTNSGAVVSDGTPITITDTLPEGMEVKSFSLEIKRQQINQGPEACVKAEPPGEPATVTCTLEEGLPEALEPALLYPGEGVRLAIHVSVPPCPGPAQPCELTNEVAVQGGGADPVFAESHNQSSDEEKAPTGFQEFNSGVSGPDGQPVSQADSHPYQYTTTFAVNLNPAPPGAGISFVPAGGDLKDVEVALPPGLVGNPNYGGASARCSIQDFNTLHGFTTPEKLSLVQNECSDASAVGYAVVEQLEGSGALIGAPIYNLIPPHGVAAQLGLQPIVGLPIFINAKLRSEGDYGISVRVHNTTEAKRLTAGKFTIWGTPSDPSHDQVRGKCVQAGEACGVPDAKPFLRLPSSCANPLLTTMSFNTWAQPSATGSGSADGGLPTNCAAPDFSPAIQARPTTNLADSPTGLHFNVHLPQAEHEADPEGLGEADLRDVSLTLPRGLVVNPSSADGLAACSTAQIGLKTQPGQTPIHFNEAPAACPDASKIGRVQAETPLLDHPVEGALYLARQGANPFNSLLALYLVVEDPISGSVVKLAGEVRPDPRSGQLTTVFKENPQLPLEDIDVDLFAGARAPLRTPPVCGNHTTTSQMVPWTAPERLPASPSDSFPITAGPAGPCPSGALAPKLSAGLAIPRAGTYSPFSLRLTRADATGEFAGLTTTMPPGLVAKLAGVPYCPQAAIDLAAARSQPGAGAVEAASPACPVASQVGTTTAGAGAGPTPFYTAGKVYLAGPYKGAPLSLLAVIPAVAGPFDLGAVAVRIALHVNSETAQVRAESDPLPTILFGIPLDVRDVRANLDRPSFTLAPTNCEPKSISATVFGISGAAASVSDRFQVGGCKDLGFKPGLSLQLKGATKRGTYPALKAVVTYPKGAYANIARASVALPHSEFLAQNHIRTICTRVQFAADACPKGSIYGKARATSPLLDEPLAGPVYLRSSSNPLPDMVVALKGQVDVDLVGRIDSVNGGIRSTFDAAPDAPITKFVLEMQGGKKGLFENSRDICKHNNRATVKLTGQNGKVHNFRPLLRDSCKKKKKSK